MAMGVVAYFLVPVLRDFLSVAGLADTAATLDRTAPRLCISLLSIWLAWLINLLGVRFYERSVVLMAAITIACLITRSLTRQLGGEPATAAEIANRIAAGDLSARIELKAGDTLILDFSALLFGYRSEVTNTLVVGGEPSAQQRLLFQHCSAAMAAGESELVAGKS